LGHALGGRVGADELRVVALEFLEFPKERIVAGVVDDWSIEYVVAIGVLVEFGDEFVDAGRYVGYVSSTGHVANLPAAEAVGEHPVQATQGAQARPQQLIVEALLDRCYRHVSVAYRHGIGVGAVAVTGLVPGDAVATHARGDLLI